MSMTKFIVITGSLISGLGKGISTSSIGFLLQKCGYSVTTTKIDPYLNEDAGTLSPYEHGECYVLEDGGEVDLDLGNYERFLGIKLTKKNSITTGKIHKRVSIKERNGYYNGETVQIVPHVTNELQEMILESVNGEDICIIEIGGTIEDFENIMILEALRQFSLKHEVCFIHLSMIIENGVEQKTKPIQQSLRALSNKGLKTSILILRSKDYVSSSIKEKICMNCSVKINNIISNIMVPNVYYVPRTFNNQDICRKIAEKLKLDKYEPDLSSYFNILKYYDNLTNLHKLKILIAGKYNPDDTSTDTYLSLLKSIEHASYKLNVKTEIEWLDTELFNDFDVKINKCDGIIIPGGFGVRGIVGKIKVCEYARENKIPILGICLGFQIMVVEYFKNVLFINASSSEWSSDHIFNNSVNVIDILPNQNNIIGGTMRLGTYITSLVENSKVSKLYNSNIIYERHRHRYEFNNAFKVLLESKELKFSGNSDGLQELLEHTNHPFYIGCQYHPEFQSSHENPHPLFIGLLQSSMNLEK